MEPDVAPERALRFDRSVPRLRGGVGGIFAWMWSDREHVRVEESICLPEEGCRRRSSPTVPRQGFAVSVDGRIGVGLSEHVGLLYDVAVLFGLAWEREKDGEGFAELGVRNAILLGLSPTDGFEMALGPNLGSFTGFDLVTVGPQLRLTTILTELDERGGGPSLFADVQPSWDTNGFVLVTMGLGLGYDWM